MNIIAAAIIAGVLILITMDVEARFDCAVLHFDAACSRIHQTYYK